MLVERNDTGSGSVSIQYLSTMDDAPLDFVDIKDLEILLMTHKRAIPEALKINEQDCSLWMGKKTDSY